MPALCGLARTDGAPVERAAALARRVASDVHPSLLASASADGGVSVVMGRAAGSPLRSVHTSSDPPGWMAAIARLDAAISPGESDAASVAGAYRQWGLDCSRRLHGDWTLAVWDASRRRLTLARDPLGISGLFYGVRDRTIAFGPTPASVAKLLGTATHVDERFLVEFLGNIWTPEATGLTAFAGVRQVLPAHLVEIDESGERLHRYWTPESVPRIALRRDADYLDAFVERWTAAVARRIPPDGAVAAMLSAGLDSSAVVATAARLPSLGGRGLIAFTSAPAHPVARREDDESQRAAAIARAAPGVDHYVVRTHALSPVAACVRLLELTGHPQYAGGNAGWMLEILGAARDRGASVMLTGQLGNATISWNAAGRALGYLRDGDGGAAWNRLRRAASAQGRGWPRALVSELISPILAPLRFQARLWRGALPADGIGHLSQDAARRAGLPALMRRSQFGAHAWPPHGERDTRHLLMTAAASMGGWLWAVLGDAYGLAFADPTADQDLVEFCLGLPARLSEARDYDRAMIRRAMTGLVPDEIRLTSVRSVQAADLGSRLLAARDEVDEAIGWARAVPLVSAARLDDTWQQIQRAGPPALAGSLLRTLTVVAFCRQPC
jgi:asparagine synthase (glutamine-hydrolysing)